jgi:uncharacterized protein
MACQEKASKDPYRYGLFLTPGGQEIKVTMVTTDQDQQKGLSGTRSENFGEDEGMLFFNLEDAPRAFWMPDTYFDLDIFFLNDQFKVIDVDRKVPHYIGYENQDRIPRARTVYARHVFEMKASSKIAQDLKVGDQLQWKFEVSPSQIESKIRQPQ